ncbi:ABC transporter ATP-binding protein [Deinococcus radiophilus]|uniref:ABC transporter ATP-binding protein n=1 Tax=Deinococcus radiophilus TaxID=32062 RepID=UPI00362346ED
MVRRSAGHGWDLTPGALIAFLFYAIQVAGAIAGLTGLVNQFQEAAGASGRIFELMGERSDLKSPVTPLELSAPRGRVRFLDVGFSYGDSAVLSGISLSVQPGQTVALVGPSGAGKTTLVSLLPRFWDVTSGQIELDGHDLRAYDLRQLRSHIGLVPQDTQLFSGNVRDNIRYGRPDAPESEVEAAAQAANAHDFILELPQGYDTVVGERGLRLSGGQRQRIAIARALLKDPRVLILDEATSALDNQSEALVQAALDRLMQGRTTFVIAHRLSTVQHADQILVMDQGQIVQRGTHAELLEAGGLYGELHRTWAEQQGQVDTGVSPQLASSPVR